MNCELPQLPSTLSLGPNFGDRANENAHGNGTATGAMFELHYSRFTYNTIGSTQFLPYERSTKFNSVVLGWDPFSNSLSLSEQIAQLFLDITFTHVYGATIFAHCG